MGSTKRTAIDLQQPHCSRQQVQLQPLVGEVAEYSVEEILSAASIRQPEFGKDDVEKNYR